MVRVRQGGGRHGAGVRDLGLLRRWWRGGVAARGLLLLLLLPGHRLVVDRVVGHVASHRTAVSEGTELGHGLGRAPGLAIWPSRGRRGDVDLGLGVAILLGQLGVPRARMETIGCDRPRDCRVRPGSCDT